MKSRSHLEVDVAVGQPIGTSFIQEINIFYQQAEEGDHNLRRGHRQEERVYVKIKMAEPMPACFQNNGSNVVLGLTLSLLLLAV